MFISLMLGALILLLVALAGAAGIFWYGKRQSEENAQPLSTDEELSYSLRARDLTEKEMHEATLSGAMAHLRIRVK